MYIVRLSLWCIFLSLRALATGISQCGSGVGQFVFAPLATFLLTYYGWESVIWFVAGLYLTCTLFGALLRPLEEKNDIEGENGSRKNSKIQIHKLIPSSLKCWESKKKKLMCPFSRKDILYSGKSGILINCEKDKETNTTWDEFRHIFDNLIS